MLVCALAVSSRFAELAVLANVASLSLYFLCVAASYELERRDVREGGTPFAVPGGPAVPLAAAAVIVWLLAQATGREMAVEGVVLAGASALYVGRALVRRSRATRGVTADRTRAADGTAAGWRGRNDSRYHRRMPHQNPSDQDIKTLLTDATTIAVVGASSNPEKSSYGIMQKLQRVGYRVIPVNPRETEVLGEKSYASLSDVPVPVDIVDVFRRAEDTPPIADEAVKIGAKASVAAERHRERGRRRARVRRRADRGDGRVHRRDARRAAGPRKSTAAR